MPQAKSIAPRLDKDQIISFAGQFDPQPYHLDDEAARKSVFGGLAASGWHTAALTMRLLVDGEFRPAHGILGVGVDERGRAQFGPAMTFTRKPKCSKCVRPNRRPIGA